MCIKCYFRIGTKQINGTKLTVTAVCKTLWQFSSVPTSNPARVAVFLLLNGRGETGGWWEDAAFRQWSIERRLWLVNKWVKMHLIVRKRQPKSCWSRQDTNSPELCVNGTSGTFSTQERFILRYVFTFDIHASTQAPRGKVVCLTS